MVNHKQFDINNFEISQESPCFIIAEIGQNHDGSLGTAHAFIDAVSKTGAHAIKFQTHIASKESTPEEPWRIKFSYQDDTRYEYWKRMEFSPEHWKGIADHCKDKNLVFLSSAFSKEAVTLLDTLKMPAWKIASGEVSNTELLSEMAQTNKPILISSGMSSISEIRQAINIVKDKSPFGVLQCTSAYPCPPEKLGLNLIATYRDIFDCPVGLSDHTGVIFSGLAAATLGIDILEVHVTLSNEMFGPDISSSITTKELSELVEGISYIEKTINNPVDKDEMAVELKPLRNLFTKSIVSLSEIPANTIIERNMITAKKPGTGIPEKNIDEVVGKKAKHNIGKDKVIKSTDIA
tara:strand:+ start:1856 stop:2905 length:1050 start_codon:yes stop_codon:yes gene_type:complete